MVQSPPLSPKVATPLAHRKRRHSALDRGSVDLTGQQEAIRKVIARVPGCPATPTKSNGLTQQPQPPANGESEQRRLDDDDLEDDDDKSLFEDMLDQADLEPYKAEESIDDFGFQPKIRKEINSRLRDLGPHNFLEEQLSHPTMTPDLLGTAFGIDPQVWVVHGRAFYMRLLELAVRRACTKRQKLPQYNTIDDAAKLVRESKNIMVITGAGISTSLGIPDFRSKDTGFYTRLLAMGIEEPEEVFDINEFDFNPRTFYELAADILPDLKRYSPTHGFIRLLQDKDKLQTNYTQNIDNLEELAGIDKTRLIQCHGSFATATCRLCKHRVRGNEIFADIRAKRISKCKRCTERIEAAEAAPKPKKSKPTPQHRIDDDDIDDDIPSPGVMKPDITFFGEQLPSNFFDRFTEQDSKTVDLVVVIGTSLKVAPVSEMPNHLPKDVPHIYISREPVEHVNFDVQLLGSSDDVVFELCRRAGWELRHEMLPKGMKVHVEKVEGSVCRWRLKREGGEAHRAPF